MSTDTGNVAALPPSYESATSDPDIGITESGPAPSAPPPTAPGPSEPSTSGEPSATVTSKPSKGTESKSNISFEIDSDAIILFIVTLLVFLVIDILFIYTVTGPMFQKMVPQIQGEPLRLRLFPAFLIYLIMTSALFYFVIWPNKGDLSKLDSTDYISAFILGLAIFAAFDLTNLAIFQNYSPYIATIDIAWGSALFAATTFGVSMAQQYILKE
jgi:uncharacterized membrane protein